MESEWIVTEAEITIHDLTITGINHDICERQCTCIRNFCLHRIIKAIISRSLRISCHSFVMVIALIILNINYSRI